MEKKTIAVLSVTIFAVVLSLSMSTTCLAQGSPYREKDRSWPVEWRRDVYDLESDLREGGDLFLEGGQLHKDGQPATSMNEFLGIVEAGNMIKVQWKEDNPEGTVTNLGTKEYSPLALYSWLVDLINQHSPEDISRIRNLRTLALMFELRKSNDFSDWQGFVTNAETAWGVTICEYIVLNRTNGHSVSVVTFPGLPMFDGRRPVLDGTAAKHSATEMLKVLQGNASREHHHISGTIESVALIKALATSEDSEIGQIVLRSNGDAAEPFEGAAVVVKVLLKTKVYVACLAGELEEASLADLRPGFLGKVVVEGPSSYPHNPGDVHVTAVALLGFSMNK